MDAQPFSPTQLEFYQSERPRINAQGITNYDEQCIELARRWEVVQRHQARPEAPAPVPVDEIRIPFALTMPEMMRERVYLAATMADGIHVYKKLASAPPYTMPPKSALCVDLEPVHRTKRVRAMDPHKIRKAVLDKLYKPTIEDMCDDLGLPYSGTKSQMIGRVAATSPSMLTDLTVYTLKEMCKDLELPSSGLKAELFDRIMNA